MILTKKRFNLTPRCRGKWPFNVPEVSIEMIIDKDNKTALFGLVYKFGRYALSGALVPFGFDELVKSGIWAPNAEYPDQLRDLTPFFEYVQAIAVEEFGGKADG